MVNGREQGTAGVFFEHFDMPIAHQAEDALTCQVITVGEVAAFWWGLQGAAHIDALTVVISDAGESPQLESATNLSGAGKSRVHLLCGERFDLDGKAGVSVAFIWRLNDQALEFDQSFTVVPGDMKGVRADLGF